MHQPTFRPPVVSLLGKNPGSLRKGGDPYLFEFA